MKRFSLAVVCVVASLSPAWGQTPEQKKATIAYLQSLRQPDGSFAPARAADGSMSSTLRGTLAAQRGLMYWGEPIDRTTATKFILSCHDKATGGFADQPGGKPDAFTTASGIMAIVEGKLPAETLDGAVKALAESARTFEEIRIAAAAHEGLGKPSPRIEEWRKQVLALRNPDGSAGKGDGAARETANVAMTMLRFGMKVDNRDQVLKTMRAGQRPDGGFGKEGSKESDMESCYRAMRAFHMLKEKPASPEKLKEFVAKCRNADGGYGLTPGQPSSASGVYYAGTVLHWLDEK